MGIEISHDAYEGSAGFFHEWRRHLFRVAGFGELNEVEEYYDPEDEDDWPNGVPDGTVIRPLREVMAKSDGLYPLIDLDDTEGSIRDDALPPLVKRLGHLMSDCPGEFLDGIRVATEQFIAGAEAAHAKREDLVVNEDPGQPRLGRNPGRRRLRPI